MNKYALAMISSLSVGRGEEVPILNGILMNTSLGVVRLRKWAICLNSWNALSVSSSGVDGNISPVTIELDVLRKIPTWIVLFRNLEDQDAYESLRSYCFKKSFRKSPHPADYGVRITHPDRLKYECDILFTPEELRSIII